MILADEEGKVAFQQCQSSKSFGKVIDLLDECWFFRNTLVAREVTENPPSVHALIASSQEKKEERENIIMMDSAAISSIAGLDRKDEHFSSAEAEFPNSQQDLLIRSPTELVVPKLTLNSLYPKLRHSMSSLEYGSASNSSSSCKMPSHKLRCTTSGGERPLKLEEKTERYRAILHYIARENYYRKAFAQNKRRSLSDLEYMEVQGSRDLGFVSHGELQGPTGPGQNNNYKSDNDDHGVLGKPFVFDSKSTQDMKDELRFWAKAVASNTKQAF